MLVSPAGPVASVQQSRASVRTARSLPVRRLLCRRLLALMPGRQPWLLPPRVQLELGLVSMGLADAADWTAPEIGECPAALCPAALHSLGMLSDASPAPDMCAREPEPGCAAADDRAVVQRPLATRCQPQSGRSPVGPHSTRSCTRMRGRSSASTMGPGSAGPCRRPSAGGRPGCAPVRSGCHLPPHSCWPGFCSPAFWGPVVGSHCVPEQPAQACSSRRCCSEARCDVQEAAKAAAGETCKGYGS